MKSKFVRSLMAVLGVAAVLVALVAANPATTTAANLTGGQYTYLVDGEEVTFTFDPVVRKDGLLLPTEVFQKFGIAIEGATTKVVTLSKANVSAKVTVGVAAMELNGQPKPLATAPLRLNGRVFLPSDLLKEFGIDFSQDGNFLSLRSYTDKLFQVKDLAEADWNNLKAMRGFTSMVKADSGVNIYSDFWLLNADMITASNLNISYGNRTRLMGMLDYNTLVLVRMSNLSNKGGGLVTTGLALVDNDRSQYDVASVLDIGSGLLTTKLAPGGDRYGVLVFPKLPKTAANAILYYDNGGLTLGTFRVFE